jgi:hypothetical protein
MIDLSIANAIQQHLDCVDFGSPQDNVVSFIAIHFWEFSIHSFDSIPDDCLRLSLSHPELKIDSEDSVYDFVVSRIDTDVASCHFLEVVEFQYLSADAISRFCKSDHGFFQYLTAVIWAPLSRRLAQTPRQKTHPRLRIPPFVSFVPDPSRPLARGIISHLTKECRRNLHEAGIVTATDRYR